MTKTATRFQVHIGGKRYRYFDTLSEAARYCSAFFKANGIVLSIVEAPPARWTR